MPDRPRFAFAVVFVASSVGWGACARDARDLERCPEREIATVNGCRPIPAGGDVPQELLAPPEDGGTAAGTPDGAEDGGGDAGDAVDPGTDAGALADSGIPAPPLVGAWALRAELAEIATPEGEDARSGTTVIRALVTAKAEGAGSELTVRVCAMDVPREPAYRVEYPASAIAAMEVARVRLASNTGSTFAPAPVALLLGFAPMGDALGEPLPSAVQDPRVVDRDGDRRPGVSLSVETLVLLRPVSGSLYVAARTVLGFEGAVAADGQVTGRVTSTRQEVRFGTSNNLIDAKQISIAQAPEGSTFSMVPLPAEAGEEAEDGCDRVRSLTDS